jgi:hypothetical protein
MRSNLYQKRRTLKSVLCHDASFECGIAAIDAALLRVEAAP